MQKIYQIFYITPCHRINWRCLWLRNGIYLVIAPRILILAYRFYGAFIAAKVLTLDEYRPTPAMVHNDGHDYVPTNKWVTFGHHFAAIAGAGPSWVLLSQPSSGIYLVHYGSLSVLLAGAVHDMALSCSHPFAMMVNLLQILHEKKSVNLLVSVLCVCYIVPIDHHPCWYGCSSS